MTWPRWLWIVGLWRSGTGTPSAVAPAQPVEAVEAVEADRQRLEDEFSDWLILARPGYGFWATPREPVVPPGRETYLAADTAASLEAQLRLQEWLRGRELPR
ncbi:hypothetical protein AB0J35_57690 [Nonomuraea angiospora]|uniref:hypothetical protein n=1 Tax=Nonomuraea angiospora TaxID=46172 RepID=UPI00341B4F55